MHGDGFQGAQPSPPANQATLVLSGALDPQWLSLVPCLASFASSKFIDSTHGLHTMRHPGASGFLPRGESGVPYQAHLCRHLLHSLWLHCSKASLDSMQKPGTRLDVLISASVCHGFWWQSLLLQNPPVSTCTWPLYWDTLRDSWSPSLSLDLL